MLKLIRLCCAIVFVCGTLSLPAFAAKKITIQELSSLLETLHDQKKSDEQISSELKLVELTEELTMQNISSYGHLQLGPITLEQLTILQYASEFQPLPSSASPDKPIPDAAEQKAILDRMGAYVNNIYSHLPDLTVTKTTARFSDAPLSQIEDFREFRANETTMGDKMNKAVGNYISYHGNTRVAMQTDKGLEKPVAGKAGPANDPQGLVAWGQFGPLLRTAATESASGGKLTWARWDTVNNVQVAVFNFSIDRKKSHYVVNYCCFPNSETSSGSPGVIAATQVAVSWNPFKTMPAYHGEFYVEPKTGYVLRFFLRADTKASDFVHQEVTRVDYATEVLDGKPYMVPKNSVILNALVISGDGGGQRYTEVHSILATEYSGYKLRSN